MASERPGKMRGAVRTSRCSPGGLYWRKSSFSYHIGGFQQGLHDVCRLQFPQRHADPAIVCLDRPVPDQSCSFLHVLCSGCHLHLLGRHVNTKRTQPDPRTLERVVVNGAQGHRFLVPDTVRRQVRVTQSDGGWFVSSSPGYRFHSAPKIAVDCCQCCWADRIGISPTANCPPHLSAGGGYCHDTQP